MADQPTKVLVVDDDPAILRLLERWLTSAGYAVSMSSGGQAAMEQIEQDCPDILVTDWEMPGVDGIELCRWVRQQDLPHYVYILFLSMRCASEDMIRGLDSGADDFLKKPVAKGELVARVRAGLRVLDLESRLSLLAQTDSLTGLFTQRPFYKDFDKEWSRAKRHHFPLSCVMIDVDYFKRVNDVYGHVAGDEVLRQVAKTLAANCRTSDIICRYGGEEFCALLPETDEDHAVLWADRIRRTLAAIEVSIDGKPLRVTASFGVAQRMSDTSSPKQLVDLADQALLVAKQSGRDRVVGYQSLHEIDAMRSAIGGVSELFSQIAARDAMTSIVAGLNRNSPVGRAADYFLRFRIQSAPVVDDAGKLVGILSERDMMSIMLWPDWWQVKIADVMKTNVVCYEEETPVIKIYEFLCRVAIRSVVIVKDERPTGVISRTSLLRWFHSAFSTGTDAASGLEPASSGGESLLQLEASARCMRDEAQRLVKLLADGQADSMAAVVGGASRVQELVNDLLAYSRYLNSPRGPEQLQSSGNPAALGNTETVEGLAALLAEM